MQISRSNATVDGAVAGASPGRWAAPAAGRVCLCGIRASRYHISLWRHLIKETRLAGTAFWKDVGRDAFMVRLGRRKRASDEAVGGCRVLRLGTMQREVSLCKVERRFQMTCCFSWFGIEFLRLDKLCDLDLRWRVVGVCMACFIRMSVGSLLLLLLRCSAAVEVARSGLLVLQEVSREIGM